MGAKPAIATAFGVGGGVNMVAGIIVFGVACFLRTILAGIFFESVS